MRQKFKYSAILFVSLAIIFTFAACGGSSGGGGGNAVTIEGTLSNSAANTKVLAEGEGGVAGVTVEALGDSQVTDANGNFTLVVDGNSFSGGSVLFMLSGSGLDTTALFDNVAGGPGATAYVDMVVESDGSVTGTSSDASGAVLSSITGLGSFGCTKMLTFSDGGGNNLWKPHSESTGTVVILMPGNYRNADFSIVDSRGKSVASVLKRHCCEHNGGRDHVYLNRTASSLAGENLPLTVRYEFSASSVDCLQVKTPTWRLD
ncbi:hypothetical protein OAO01_07315 [Oligoflexia bacterium]|nr:hypothetical protein [Oligoflexia bacterium]